MEYIFYSIVAICTAVTVCYFFYLLSKAPPIDFTSDFRYSNRRPLFDPNTYTTKVSRITKIVNGKKVEMTDEEKKETEESLNKIFDEDWDEYFKLFDKPKGKPDDPSSGTKH